jgi:uncharacterized repeat protein (TIGR02543 family)
MSKKLLALLLVFCVVFASLPVYAFQVRESTLYADTFYEPEELRESSIADRNIEKNPTNEEGLESKDLKVGTDSGAVYVRQSRGPRDEIHIRTKEELIEFLNTSYHLSAYISGDEYRYGVKDTDIYLDGSFEISSDDINAQIPENTKYNKYQNSFNLTNSNFYGQGNTITINKGNRDMYSLFGNMYVYEEGFVSTVDNLNIVYNGDVRGAGLAQNIDSNYNTKSYDLNNINIEVNGNILPLITENNYDSVGSTHYYATDARAAGFVFSLVSANLDGVDIHVTGNIGTENPEKSDYADTDLIYARSSGFILWKNHRWPNTDSFRDITNLKIKVGGSILATSSHSRAEATGLGYDLQAKILKGIDLDVGGDIKAETSGDYILHSDQGYSHTPLIAAAGGHDLHYLEDANINIGGSIKAINNGNINFDTIAAGIGQWDYINDLSDDEVKDFPLTIKNVNLKVGGDISAESTKEYRKRDDNTDNKPIRTVACAGFINNMNAGLENYDLFEENNIQVAGDIVSKGKDGISTAGLWGYFMGDDNIMSAKSLQASNEKDFVYVAPFYGFVRGQRNKISLQNDIVAKGVGGNVAGFANQVTQFDGLADQNEINIKGIQAEGISKFGGFANYAEKHRNQPDIDVDVKNVDLALDDTTIVSPKEGAIIGGFISRSDGDIENCTVRGKNFTVNDCSAAYIGGFIGYNTKSGNLNNNTVYLEDLIVKGSGNVGGYVGYNSGNIENSAANLKSISVLGDAEKQASNNHNVGGFSGYGYNGSVNNSTAFVENSIKAENGNYVNLGGFTGIVYDQTYSNNAAQVGEDLSATNNVGVVNIGGFAGKLQAFRSNSLIDKSTALVFGDIVGDSTSTNNPSLAGGFAGVLSGKDNPETAIIQNSASYVGGKLQMTGEASGAATAVGLIYDASLKGFTALGTISEDEDQNKAMLDNYLAGANNLVFENNYFVEVKDSNRKAFPITLTSEEEFLKGDEIGNIDIAVRKLQDKYWGKDAASENAEDPYNDFEYVIKNSNGIILNAISTGSSVVSSGEFKTASLVDFYTRHLALWSGNDSEQAPIYDILGIPAGKYIAETVKVSFDLNYDNAGIYKVEEAEAGKSLGSNFPVPPSRDGYEFKGWNTEADGSGLSFTKDTLVEGDITVYAQWEEVGQKPDPEEPGKPDKPDAGGDSESHGGSHSSNHLVEKADLELNKKDHYQYMIGYKDSSFKPENNMTREEVAVMFSRLLLNQPKKGHVYDYNLSDVERDRWSITAISYMNQLGIIKGYPDGTFKPEDSITRAEFAAIATRFAKLSEGDKTFNDLSADHWAYDLVKSAASAGWINGYPDGSFKPDKEISRAEVVTIVNEMLNRHGDKEFIDKNNSKILYLSDIKDHWAYYSIVEATNGHDYLRFDNNRDELWKEVNEKSFVYDKN